MTFTLYPAIDLRHGKVVQLVGGDPAQVALERPDPEAQADLFAEAGATWLHVIDLDAAFGERNQWTHLTRILRAGTQVQFGGGVRSMTQVQQLLDLGVARVVVGTQGVRHPAWARELAILFPGRVVLAIDARGRDVAVSGWTEAAGVDVVELAASLDGAGLAGFLYTNVDKEGRLGGIDRDTIAAIRLAAPRTPLLASGGITTLDDLEWLKGAGVAGAVLGMSIYKGTIDLGEAFSRFPPPAVPVVRVLHAREELAGEGEAEDMEDAG
ncbi:MAG TPA: 1-(5-phosphoribosyl)-5-[(5-phosphoribosylamino)methylideneamino] imidazole-4-carboxamide isomerase [Candidatus Thermoplasmatota archaeon]|nr:1-(5-phosphoribosyl)-5-[(5-phosphoribosylamino)methylideneamino] imidazole-4-carboxamide isomerase [Candidatus Thermoplasmatota archaeon]